MLTFQNYIRAQSLEEAYELNQKKQNRVIGGMLWLKMSSASANTVIDLCDLGLDTIEENDEQFSIGAMVTLRQLEQSEALNQYTCGMAAKAVRNIVGVQFRNMATVGGSLWGRFGFSDVLTLFLSMESYVELYKGGTVPLEEFVSMKRDNDILVRLIVKKVPGKFSYEAMRIQKTDLPVLNVSASLLGNEARVVIGARPGKGVIVRDEKGILANGITPDSAKAFADYAASSVRTSSNLRGSAAYRTHLAKVLTERNLLTLGGLR